MTLAELSAGEIFAGVTHIIQKQTGISELEAFPRADQVARRLSPSRPPADKHFSSLLRQYELVGSVKASIHLEDRTDQTIHGAAIEALEKLDALEASASPSASASAAASDHPRRIKPGLLQDFIRTCAYCYREDRLLLVMMSVPVLATLAALLLFVHRISSGLL